MINKEPRNRLRKNRHDSVRKNLTGTKDVPRLTVFKSLKNVYVQIIDDVDRHTIISASSNEKEFKALACSKKEKYEKIGTLIAKRALEKGIKEIKFDRSGYKYHGNIAILAESARKEGLQF